MTSLSASLASVRNELDANTSRLHALVDTMDEAAWRTKPGAGRWSVAECTEHLNITASAYVPLLDNALKEGRARGLTNPGGSNRLGLLGWLLVRYLEPPVRRRRRTMTGPAFMPAMVEPKAKVVTEWEQLHRELISLLGEGDGLALSKIKVPSPFNSKLNYSVYAAYRVLAAHERRHLWQAEQAHEEVRSKAR